jgi:hypothetical protein
VFPSTKGTKVRWRESQAFMAGRAAGDRVRINLERKVAERSSVLMLG